MATGDPAGASRLGPATDAVWERMGGGPADLYFPKEFEGVWQVDSTLLTMDEPLGAEMVRDREVAERAAREDLQKTITYPVKFTLNSQGRVVLDRRFNTAALLEHYYGSSFSFGSRIVWDIDDPNQLRIQLPAGRSVSTRVTRRLLEKPASDRIDTSEYFQQVFESQDPGVQPKVTASQCFTKYRFRSQTAAAGGAQIVATQVVSDFLTSYDDQKKFMDAKGRPVLVYTYRLAFSRSSA